MSRFPKEVSLKRKFKQQSPKNKIYVLCEGKVTEPEYIYKFARQFANNKVIVQTIPGVGVPLTVAEQAVILKKQLLREAKKLKDSFELAFSVWCVIDVDEHPKIAEAEALANSNKIKVCISNPCFELWGLLHLDDQNAHIHRHKLQQDLHKVMPKYHHKTNPILDYRFIEDLYPVARRRALKICKDRKDEGKEGCNPSTNVYELLDYIIINGKKR
jgi:hypothetical protein